MAEVISGGPPERPSADRASRVAVAVLAAAAVLSAGTWVGLHRSSSTSAQRPPISDAGGTPTPSIFSAPLAPLQPVLSGVSTAGPIGLRLLAGGPALSLVDAGTGVRSPVASVDVPADHAVAQLEPVGAGTLVVVISTASNDEAGWVYLELPAGPAVKLLRADRVVPGARPGRFWAYTYSRRQGAKSTLVEATTTGRVLSTRLVPAGWEVEADTGGGLLVAASPVEGPGELLLVDPTTLLVRRSLGPVAIVVAASASLVAWTTDPGCHQRCDLLVADPALGVRRGYRLATNFAGANGAFDPSGRRVAIAYFGRHAVDGPATSGFVEVLDLATGRRTRVPGVATPQKQAAAVSWFKDGRWLGIAVQWPDEGYQRLAVWPVSGGPVRELPGRLPAGYSSALLALPSRSAP